MIVIVQQRIELKVGLRVNGTNKDGIDGDPLVEETNDFDYVPIDGLILLDEMFLEKI